MTAPAARLLWVDVARGLSLWAMAAFHLTWDLAHFGWIDPTTPYTPMFRWLGHVIAASFLLLVGVSLVLAQSARGPLLRSRAFWRRWAMIAAAAAAISLASYWLFPSTPIFFGILHCIALASLIAAPFAAAPSAWALAAGALALAAPALFAAPFFDAPTFWWTGLGTFETPSNDYRPLLPWLAFVLFGVGLGRLRPPHPALTRHLLPQGEKGSPLPRALAFCGRHSLAFYLIHQPILFGLLSLLALFVVSPAHERIFVGQCADQCVRETAEPDICQRTCECTVTHAKARGFWPAMARDALSPDQKAEAHVDIMACFAER